MLAAFVLAVIIIAAVSGAIGRSFTTKPGRPHSTRLGGGLLIVLVAPVLLTFLLGAFFAVEVGIAGFAAIAAVLISLFMQTGRD
jgi:hypothetical protein